MFCCVRRLSSHKDKLRHSQNSKVTSLSCQLLDSLRHVFIKVRKDYNIGKLTSFKAFSNECNQSLTVGHMTELGHNMKRDYFKIRTNQNPSNTAYKQKFCLILPMSSCFVPTPHANGGPRQPPLFYKTLYPKNLKFCMLLEGCF